MAVDLSPAAALLDILELANERGKFAIQIGAGGDALGEAIDGELVRLVDVTTLPHVAQGRLVFRIFQTTPAGIARCEQLRNARDGRKPS